MTNRFPFSNNVFDKNKEKRFELTYIPLEEVKAHLKQILPNIIARYLTDLPESNENGKFDHLSQIVGVNETNHNKIMDIHSNPEKKYITHLELRLFCYMNYLGIVSFAYSLVITPPTKYYKQEMEYEYADKFQGDGRILKAFCLQIKPIP